MNARDIATAKTSELLAFFNANTGGAQVKKFADRATAERRVAALIIEIEAEQNPITAELVAEVAADSSRGEAWENGELGCSEEHAVAASHGAQAVIETHINSGKARPAMAESLKLDRRITHVDTGTVYANACQVWKAGLVSASQGDRLSSALYGAAKKGDYISLTVNGHTFTLTAR